MSHYFFPDFFYAFRYSPIIFFLLVICSFIISVLITHTRNVLVSTVKM